MTVIENGIFFSGTEGVTIVCNAGSAAEEYAKKAGIPYIRYPSLSDTSIELIKGQYTSLPILYDGLMEFGVLSCKSENPSVAVFENGVIMGVSPGTTMLHITIETLEFDLSVSVEGTGAVFPCGLTAIQTGTFANAAFATIEIPDSVNTIESRAFAGCEMLEKILIPESVVSIADDAFESCPLLTIVCHEGSYAHQYALSHGIQIELFAQ